MTKVRIHKYLADIGVASRRAIEEMILEGRITVNSQAIRKLPCFVTIGEDQIRVDGRLIKAKHSNKVYFLLNKPRGVVCTASDPRGRPKAVDLIPKTGHRIYCVGRLDEDSTGIIVMTNDGELTQKLTHPSYEVPKTYVVEVEGRIEHDGLQKLQRGIYLDGSRTKSARVRVLKKGFTQSMLEIQLSEGRNREIRRLLSRLGHEVKRLKRTAIGRITDRGLKIGSCRALTPTEVRQLQKYVETPPPASPKSAKPAAARKTPSRKSEPRKGSATRPTSRKPARKYAEKASPAKTTSASGKATAKPTRARKSATAKPTRSKRGATAKPRRAAKPAGTRIIRRKKPSRPNRTE